MLDNSDIERILPYYFFDYRLSLKAKEKALESGESGEMEDNIVFRDGKKYRKVTAGEVSWVDKIF